MTEREIRHVAINDLKPYAGNPRTHPEGQIKALAKGLREFGFTNPMLVDADLGIIGGHGRLEAAKLAGLKTVPVVVLDHLTAEQVQAYRLADNQLALMGGWDDDFLAAELLALSEVDFDMALTGFDEAMMASLLADTSEPDDTVVEPPAKPVTKVGDLWVLGEHRLLCGDSREKATCDALFDQQIPQLILTDPPYCSGGFQEAGKLRGSVGTTVGHPGHVVNDRLSTRGYQALLKDVFRISGVDFLYCFTDWRMWINLFDVVESCALSVRSMIVWDKMTLGMGLGWRTQHELIMWAARKTPPFDIKMGGCGNVIQAKRTGNVEHTTQKPVDLLEALLANVPFCKIVYDPFVGSGTTIIAAERQRRRCFAIEIDPGYCDVTIRRWEDHTGLKAERIS